MQRSIKRSNNIVRGESIDFGSLKHAGKWPYDSVVVSNPKGNVLLASSNSLAGIVAPHLIKSGYNLMVAQGDNDALQKIQSSPFDVIITQLPFYFGDSNLEETKRILGRLMAEDFIVPTIFLGTKTTKTLSYLAGGLSSGIPNNAGFIDIKELKHDTDRALSDLESKIEKALFDPSFGVRARVHAQYDRLGLLWEQELSDFDWGHISGTDAFSNTYSSNRYLTSLGIVSIRGDEELYPEGIIGPENQHIAKDIFSASIELGRWMKRRARTANDGSVVGIRTNSQRGVISAPIFTELKKEAKYSEDSVIYLIKPIPSRTHFDIFYSDFFTYAHGRSPFPLTKPLKFYTEASSKEAHMLLEGSIAPNIGYLMTILNENRPELDFSDRPMIDHKDAEFELEGRLVDTMVYLAQELAVEWFKRTTPEINTPKLSIEESISNYGKKIKEGFLHASEHLNISFSSHEIEEILTYINPKLDNLADHPHMFGRIMDNSPGNHGIHLGIMQPSKEQFLSSVKSMIETSFGRSGSLVNQYTIQLTKVLRERWRLFDQYIGINEEGSFEPRHIMDDYFAMSCSYEAQRTERKKMNDYQNFLEFLFPDRFENGLPSKSLNSFWDDFLIMGFIRNFRKADLIIHKYMATNDEDYATFKIAESEYLSLKDFYIREWEHHMLQAEKFAVLDAVVEINPNANFKDNMTLLGLHMESYIQDSKMDPDLGVNAQRLLRKGVVALPLEGRVKQAYDTPLFNAVRKMRNASLREVYAA